MDINGVYMGFSPTDESDVVRGELELTIDDQWVTTRFATGFEIEEEKFPRENLRQMTLNEIAARLGIDDTDAVSRLVKAGYTCGPDLMTLILCREDSEEYKEYPGAAFVLVLDFVSDEIDEIFGPTILFTPEQVAAGHYAEAVENLEAEVNDPGVLPRLSNDGMRLGRE